MVVMGNWIRENAGDVIFTSALLSVAVGFFWAWAPLGLIVPGLIVCGIMVWSRRSKDVTVNRTDEDKEGQSDA